MSQTTIELPVSGMTCASCARSVERVLNQLPGVANSAVSFPLRKVQVTYDDSQVSLHQISEGIRSIGFDVLEASSPKKLTEAKLEADHRIQQRQWQRFWLGVYLTIPVFLVSMGRDFSLLGSWANSLWVSWLMGLLATPVQFVVGAEYYVNAWKALRHRFASMDVLVSIGSTTAYLYSFWVLIALSMDLHNWGHHIYFETSATIITLILLGRIVESGAQRRTGAAIQKLIGLQSETAIVLRNLSEIELPIDELQIGDVVVVRPGGRMPIDGMVRSGSSTVDESMLTGESVPSSKEKGDRVYAGTMNQQGWLHVTVTSPNNQTILAQIVKQVEHAQSTKAPIQKLADTVSNVFVPIVLLVAGLTFVVWAWVFSDYESAIIRSITVLIISCPCAMGLATPLAIMVGMGRGAEMGVLFKSSEALQTMSSVRHMILDKTGTITTGKLAVIDVVSHDASPEGLQRVLQVAAELEQGSEHPIARAIVNYSRKRLATGSEGSIPKHPHGAPGSKMDSFQAVPGKGAKARIDGRWFHIGSDRWMRQLGTASDQLLLDTANEWEKNGRIVLWLAEDQRAIGVFCLSDTLKTTAPLAITELQEMGIGISLLSGDKWGTAEAMANQVGIQNVTAEVLPSEKAEHVRKFQTEFSKNKAEHSGLPIGGSQRLHYVAMVGDGINDAPALVQADVGIAMGTGTDIAIESADVTLINGDIATLPRAVKLSQAIMRIIKQNLFWAFAYNILLIPVAAGVLAGFASLPIYLRQLHPIMAALAMVLSDLVIVTNALRLRKS